MRAAAPGTALDAAQAAAADRGLKALVPFGGQPFLAYGLTALADAGYTDVCIVTGPSPDPVRACVEGLPLRRLRIHFAVQDSPAGSADALAAARQFAGENDFALINSDNLYPPAALSALSDIRGSGLIGFEQAGLHAGNIGAQRLAAYAIIETDASGALRGIVEKPDSAAMRSAGGSPLISMTCWRFGAGIFEAVRETPRSIRGEYEIPDAVRIAMRTERFVVVPMSVPVLDLSRREDIPRVAALLKGQRVSL